MFVVVCACVLFLSIIECVCLFVSYCVMLYVVCVCVFKNVFVCFVVSYGLMPYGCFVCVCVFCVLCKIVCGLCLRFNA